MKGGEYAVDVFFCMAAFLATYVMLGKLAKSGGWINPLLSYFHRWWRLIFPLVIVTLVGMYIIPYLIRGPLSQSYIYMINKNCYKYWWTNFIFINNLYPWDLMQECMPHTWYMANDFQFFLITPFILMLLHKSKLAGYVTTLLLCALSIVCVVIISYHYDFVLPNPHGYPADAYYTKPWCRISTYLVGVLLGQMYYDRKLAIKGTHPHLINSFGNRFFALYKSTMCTWASALIGVAITTFLVCIYHLLSSGSWDISPSSAWYSTSRPLFVSGMMLVLMPTFEGRLPLVRVFLSCGFFQVMGRLTYSAYLIHIHVLEAINVSIKGT